MRRHRPLAVFASAAAMVLLAAGCSSTAPPPDTVAFELHGNRGDGLSVRVSSGAIRQAVESALGSSFDCGGEVDPAFASLLAELDRKGPRSRASVRRDGDVLHGFRHGRRLDLTISGDDGGRLDVRMPWAVAECLLGRAPTLRAALARSGGKPVLEVRLADGEGGRISASLE